MQSSALYSKKKSHIIIIIFYQPKVTYYIINQVSKYNIMPYIKKKKKNIY